MAKINEDARRMVSLFVDEMIEQRKQNGWSQQDLASNAGYSKSLIAAVENYERAPTLVLADALDTAYKLPGTFLRLHKKMGSVAFPVAFGEFAEVERTASELFIWDHSYLPGLLQPEDYARHMLSRHLNVTDEVIAERVTARLERQAVLTRTEPAAPIAWFMIDGQALRRPVGPSEVMHAALMNLVKMAELPNVT